MKLTDTFIIRFLKKYLKLEFVILAITATLYWPIFKNGLTNWDDPAYILYNPYLKSLPFDNLKNIFTTFYAGNYHPLTLVSLIIDYQFGGINAWPYQASNLIMHLINIMLVFVFAKHLLKLMQYDDPKYRLIPMVTALLFGIHPFQVESVAWISERKNVLYTLFFLSSLISYIWYLNGKLKRWYFLSITLFLMSLLSKGMAVPLTLSVLCIDYFAGRNLWSKKILLEKIPFILLSLIFGFVAIIAQQSDETIGLQSGLSFLEQTTAASYGFSFYLIKLVYPYHLSAFYPYPFYPGEVLSGLYYTLIIVVAVFLVALWYFFRTNKMILFGLLFFIANIGIVIQLLPVGDAVMADRYVYVASIGFFLSIGYGCTIFWYKNAIWRNSIIILLPVYLVILSLKTHSRIRIWKDSETLWNDVLKNYPNNNDRVYQNLGAIDYEKGNFSGALINYQKVLKIKPRNKSKVYSKAYNGIGITNQALKNFEGAMDNFNTSLLYRETFEGYLNRAVLKMEIKDIEGAKADLGKACSLDSLRAEIYINRGIIELNSENTDEALFEFNKAVEVNVNNYQAYLCRGYTRFYKADYTGAITDMNASVQLHPNSEAYYYRGISNIKLSNEVNGCADLKQAEALGYTNAQKDIQQFCK